MHTTLRFLAPYLAVAVFWFGFSNAWLTVIAYHGQILFFARGLIPAPRLPAQRNHLLWAVPAIFIGPLLYVILPFLAGQNLSAWLLQHRMSPAMLMVLLPYFGLVHPWLEQLHWSPLRQHTPFAHPLFAGYHVIVLAALTSWPWLLVALASLMGVSLFWGWVTKHSKSLVPAYASHAIADIGIVIAAFLRA